MGEMMLHENQYRDVNYDYALNYQSFIDNPHLPMQTTPYTQYSVKNLLNLVDDAQRKDDMKYPFDLPTLTDQWFPALHQPLPVAMKQNFAPQWHSLDESVKTVANFQKEMRNTGASLEKIDVQNNTTMIKMAENSTKTKLKRKPRILFTQLFLAKNYDVNARNPAQNVFSINVNDLRNSFKNKHLPPSPRKKD